MITSKVRVKLALPLPVVRICVGINKALSITEAYNVTRDLSK